MLKTTLGPRSSSKSQSNLYPHDPTTFPHTKLLVQNTGTADVSVNSRWFEGDKERRSLADQAKALETKIQLDIDNAAGG
ncbi:hypothetical protein FNYG_12293 [Fusarium nygamai]|uniref:Uncharacterized protein n=1 Tax=Gibberella nygamai TaxID=42673 RepID=A0A2K0VW44_GIBNY|nr:hypothetical protein FNYG_12293 [Fusarium nygamai]